MKLFKQTALVLLCSFFWSDIQAATEVDYHIQPYLDVSYGIFHSQKSYGNPEVQQSSTTWQELAASYGLKANASFNQHAVYGSVIATSTATFGDGDASHVSNGHERRNNIGEWSLGLKDTPAEQAYEHYNVSLGRQNIVVGDGFMVAGDAVNLGRAAADGSLDRGGAYYLAPRKAFDFSAVVQYRPVENLTTGLYYLKSNNKAQYDAELFVADALYQQDKFAVGGSYLGVIDVDDPLQQTRRAHLKNYALRGQYQFNPDFQLKGEVVYQDNAQSNENAAYLAFNYKVPHSPHSAEWGYRFSLYSEHYDPMFYGNTVGLGGWIQGEVAGNYAGPNNKNTQVHQLSFSIKPKENLMFGAFAYRFETLKKSVQDLSSYELDFYSVWSPKKHIQVVPLIGFYKADKGMEQGGSQLFDHKLNSYTQLLLQYTY